MTAHTSPAVAIIPARWASSRFPGKPLADRTGKPLVQHVVEQVARCEMIGRIIVATDDERIASAVRSFGGEAVMTSETHPNGTSRLDEAATILSLDDDTWVCNVQGDEPEIDPALIDLTISHTLNAADAGVQVGTLAGPFADDEDPADPNIVKVVVGQQEMALYFTRALVPHRRDPTSVHPAVPLKHVGLYVYTRRFLRRYVGLPPTPLEQTEQLEQLRILEHGIPIAVAIADAKHHGIDTPEQYEQFVRRLGNQGQAPPRH
ncbi:MAG: 3-deoxy-manno-octulosonate cytidylyltransferase [Phycisphaerales bacterium]|nr:3-deoxy-manno-octulosonate cytidylyltransferase [Phycisphaerales bacterium]